MREPAEVRELTDGTTLDLAGLTMTVDHTPGHTRGSVVFRTELEEGGRVMFAGDTLFAGSIGRTDLPGGDMRTMTETLRDQDAAPARRDGGAARPRPSTTIGRERATQPVPPRSWTTQRAPVRPGACDVTVTRTRSRIPLTLADQTSARRRGCVAVGVALVFGAAVGGIVGVVRGPDRRRWSPPGVVIVLLTLCRGCPAAARSGSRAPAWWPRRSVASRSTCARSTRSS